MFPALKEAQERLDAKNAELAKIFDEAGPDIDFRQVKSLPAGVPMGDSRAIAALVRRLNEEAAAIGVEVDEYKGVEAAAERARKGRPGAGESGDGPAGRGGDGEAMSIGRAFVKSRAFRDRTGPIGPEAHLDIELKTLMTTAAGWAPESTRTGKVVEAATRPVQVTDLIPSGTTTQNAVTYMEETTFTNAAAEVDEAGAYQEATLVLTERTSNVRKIAVYLSVTDEQLDDEPQAEGYINNRLPFMIRQKLDSQILVGSGTGTPTQLRGLLNVVGIQTQAKGADPTPDAAYKAMIKVRVTGRALPSAFVFHPTNWQDVRLLRTADGIYIWGNPSDAGPERMWGLTVAQSDAITLGTALVADFPNFTELTTRKGIDVQVSNSHSDYFINGKQAIRADMRVALVVYRPAAICTITGL